MTAVGMAGVGARIAELQQRFAAVPTFSGDLLAGAGGSAAARPAGAAGGGVGGVGGVSGAGLGAPLPAPAAVPGAPDAGAGPDAAVSAAPSTPPVPSALGASGWVGRLPEAGRPWAPAIERAAAAEGVDPLLLAALVQVESGFRPGARSGAGAVGLGQLMPATARSLGVDPTDPEQNLTGAARYLRQQLDRFGSVELALAAYNAGPGRVAQAGGIPRIAETQGYVAKVTAALQHLRSA